jgi:DnaK suppressor protein
MIEGRDDEHDPDGLTPAVEHALAFGLLKAAEAHLREVDQAIERLAAGTYGRCRRCGAMIAQERLEALPAAVTCVRC